MSLPTHQGLRAVRRAGTFSPLCRGGDLKCSSWSLASFLTPSAQGYSGPVYFGSCNKVLLNITCHFQAALLAAQTWGQPSNLRAIVDEPGIEKPGCTGRGERVFSPAETKKAHAAEITQAPFQRTSSRSTPCLENAK